MSHSGSGCHLHRWLTLWTFTELHAYDMCIFLYGMSIKFHQNKRRYNKHQPLIQILAAKNFLTTYLITTLPHPWVKAFWLPNHGCLGDRHCPPSASYFSSHPDTATNIVSVPWPCSGQLLDSDQAVLRISPSHDSSHEFLLIPQVPMSMHNLYLKDMPASMSPECSGCLRQSSHDSSCHCLISFPLRGQGLCLFHTYPSYFAWHWAYAL